MNVSGDGLFHLAGYAIAGLGVVLAVWAVALRDGRRSKRPPRCPRCWYDMSGAVAKYPADGARRAGLICPECGHDAVRPARLFHRRRSWRFAAFGIALMAVGYAAWTTPRVRARGWIGAVPTTAIIAGMPWMDPVEREVISWLDGSWRKTGLSARLANELVSERIDKNTLWEWQAWQLARRCAAGDAERRPCSQGWQSYYEPILKAVERSIRDDRTDLSPRWFADLVEDLCGMQVVCRESWPAGVPIYVSSEPYWYAAASDIRWDLRPVTPGLRPLGDTWIKPSYLQRSCGGTIRSEPWSDWLVEVGVVSSMAPYLEFVERFERGSAKHGNWNVMREGPRRVPIRVIAESGRTPDEVARTIVRPVVSAEIADAIVKQGKVKGVVLADRGADVSFNLEAMADLLYRERLTLALRLELLRDGAVVGRAEAWWRSIVIGGHPPMLFPFSPYNQVHMEIGGSPRKAADEEARWSLRVTGDPVVALRDFDAQAYWEGEVTVPIEFKDAEAR